MKTAHQFIVDAIESAILDFGGDETEETMDAVEELKQEHKFKVEHSDD